MTDLSKATPRPWMEYQGEIYGADDYRIADPTHGPHLHIDYTGNNGHWANIPRSHTERDEDEELANAALIVKAVNLYDELVAALHEARRILAKLADPDTGFVAAEARARRVLAKVDAP